MKTETEDGTQVVVNDNGNSGKVSISKFSHLLASQDRDFLLSPTGAQVKVSDLEGKVVGLLFAANWYPPCRGFTQILVGIYEEVKSKSNVPQFEIVYVSSDEDLDAFNSFYANMPWLAIPFSDLETKKALTRKYDVEGIPCLILLQPDYSKDDVRDGVELIYRYGVQAYPFSNDRLEQLQKEENVKLENQTLVNLLVNNYREYVLSHTHTGLKQRILFRLTGYCSCTQVPVDSLVGKTIGLYFSAEWCVPCAKFTPKLISVYEKIKHELAEKGEEDFEVVLISSDRDQASFDSYYSSMPWLALPFGDPEIKNLVRHFNVQGVPWLVIIGPDGKTITVHGRSLINLYQENAYPFTSAKVEELEKQLEEEAKGLPTLVYHEGHRHDLNLVSDGNGGGPFICCVCDEQGSSWAYQCLQCGYEVHPKAFQFRTSPSPSLFFSATSYKFRSATATAASGSAGVSDSGGERTLNFSGVRLEEAVDSRIGSRKLRLDSWISSRINGISRARVQSSIKSGLVHVNGRVVDKVSFNVKAGDQIKCTIAELQNLRAVPENIPLDIVYEDEHVLVINKPAHMVVHPAPGNTSGTLVNGILHHCNLPNVEFSKEEALSDTEDSDDEFNSHGSLESSCEGLNSRLSMASIRPGIVHRLDKGTSGLLVVAKDEHSHMKLSEQFKQRTIERVYVSLTAGVPAPVAGRVEVPVGRDLNNRIRMTAVAGPVNSRKARHAASRYRVIEILAGGSCSLVEWKLETGRTHQIRAHAKYLGVPLLGDEVYGGTKSMVLSLLRPRTPISLHSKIVKMVSRLDRPCLHALTLGFQHPHTGEQVHFSCEPPADFDEILSQIRRIGSEKVSFSKRSNL
ncbi:RNA pseudouridine synthase 2, chloroplastic, partial [Mucuna pruriens]